MAIITNALYYSIMNDFVSTFNTGNYYVFGSTLTADDASINTDKSVTTFIEKTIFGKKVDTRDVLYMIRRVTWQPNIVYEQYDDSIDLTGKNFYVVSEPSTESGDFRVFKCLSNNYGSVSTEKPIYTDELATQNYILTTADGYRWKYMYRVNGSRVASYATRTLFPVEPDANVIASAKQGIDSIIVENPTSNFGYESLTGTLSSIRSTDTTAGLRTIFLNATTFNQFRDYYNGYTLYIVSSNGVTSRKYTVVESGVNPQDQRPFVSVSGYVEGDISDTVSTTWTFTISPTVEIVGDGTGASALSVVTNNRITDIRILSSGQNYTRVVARIKPPTFGFDPANSLSGDVTCKIRAMCGPNNFYNGVAGHGGNPAYELQARHVLIATQFEEASDAFIPISNSYSKIGLVRNPTFTSVTPPNTFDNRIKVTLTSVTQIPVGSVVTQPSTNFRGIVHTVDDINNIIYVTEYFGPYNDQSEAASLFLSNITPLSNDDPVTTTVGRIEIEPDGIEYPIFNHDSGEVLYITDFEPIERSADLSEQYKFIISF